MNQIISDKISEKKSDKPTKTETNSINSDKTQESSSCKTLAFTENRLLSDLFGEHDNNLKLIENKLNIKIIPRGNVITIKGNSISCECAENVLNEMYDRLNQGLEISLGDIDGAIRLHKNKEDEKAISLPNIEIKTKRKTITPRSHNQKVYMHALAKHSLVFGVGPAGTGKTYIAVAHAAAALAKGDVDRIILSRPAVEAGERLGFLPGDMKEKIDPYLQPLYDALYDLMPANHVVKGLEDGIIEIAPLAFMRGRTLNNAYIILDEAQNCTKIQMKMFLTRLGENSRMVVTGDPSQIDLPNKVESGLVEALAVLQNIDGIAKIEFNSNDVIRHSLVTQIIRAYDYSAKKNFKDNHK